MAIETSDLIAQIKEKDAVKETLVEALRNHAEFKKMLPELCENDLAGIMRNSEHVRKTLVDELKGDEAFSESIVSLIQAEQQRQQEARPKLLSLEYWKQSTIWGPVLGFVVFAAALFGLSLNDFLHPRAWAHELLDTDQRVVNVVKGAPNSETAQVFATELEAKLAGLIGSDKDENPVRDSIRGVIEARPVVISHDWQPFDVFPAQPAFSSQCQNELRQIEQELQFVETNKLIPASEKQSVLISGGLWEQSPDKDVIERDINAARFSMHELTGKQQEKMMSCYSQMPDPRLIFSFYAEPGQDTVEARFRILELTKAEDLRVMTPSDKVAFSATISSLSQDHEDPNLSKPIPLKVTGDGVLAASINLQSDEAGGSRMDRIHKIVIALDRSEIRPDTLNFVVGAVFFVNKQTDNG